MEHVSAKVWSERWRKVRLGPAGGQGSSKVVVRLGDSPSGGTAPERFLKLLNRQGDPERRARLYSEVAALETLAIAGVPALVESNARHYLDLDHKLYLVTEFVQGETLTDAFVARGGPWSLAEALNIAARLAGIVEHCHAAGVLHRDVKPENVMLGPGGEVCLVDFGQAFRADAGDRAHETLPEQALGNRFIALPEFGLLSDNKRDERSDVSACVGVLYFLLTGRWPGALLDHDGRAPHQREYARVILDGLPDHVRPAVLEIFDRAFQVRLDNRIQSARAFRELVLRAEEEREAPPPTGRDAVAAIKAIAAGAWLHQAQAFNRLASGVLKELQAAVRALAADLGPAFQTSQTGWGIDPAHGTGQTQLSIEPVGEPGSGFGAVLAVTVTGAEVVLTARPLNSNRPGAARPVEIGRMRADEASGLPPTAMAALQEVFSNGLLEALENRRPGEGP